MSLCIVLEPKTKHQLLGDKLKKGPYANNV